MARKGLNLRLNGDIVHKDEDVRVLRVQVMSARGEIAAVNIAPDDEVLDIVVTTQGYLNPHLRDVDEEVRQQQRKEAAKRAEGNPEGERDLVGVGANPDESVNLKGDGSVKSTKKKSS